jgi:putative DNA primase/helicase
MSTESALQAALEVASRGYSVFPCLESKKPACPHGFHDAARDAEAVRKLWHAHPGLLIGIPTGYGNEIAVLDFDTCKHYEAVVWLQAHGPRRA